MPLPPALFERLKKRGIISQPSPQVEVYAEHKKTENVKDDEIERNDGYENRGGALGCPNKWNEYHKCVDYCFDHWREGGSEEQLPPIYLAKRKEWLKKYPLADNWKEVYDPGVRRFYYWNSFTDEVCWFPPKHPRAIISISGPHAAQIFYEELENEQAKTVTNQKNLKRKKRDDEREDRRREPKSEEESEEEIELSDREKLKRARRRGIDPMDPAAYGDNVPIGGWSTGINKDMTEAADDSATGALFERRPYPAPGAVLRKNPNSQKD